MEKFDRSEMESAVIEAYMELFVIMQENAVSHWLMHELTFAQARALIVLASRGTLSVSALGKMLGVSLPTVSLLVQQLVDRGLVERQEDPSDRRRTIVRLSEKGAEIGGERRTRRVEQWKRWLSRISDGELESFSYGLRSVIEAVRQEREIRL